MGANSAAFAFNVVHCPEAGVESMDANGGEDEMVTEVEVELSEDPGAEVLGMSELLG